MATFSTRSTHAHYWLSLGVGLILLVSLATSPVAAQMSLQTTPTTAKLPFRLHNYLNTAFDLIQNNALNSDQIEDWPALRAQAMSLVSSTATTTADTYPAIRFVIQALNDHHSMFWEPELAAQIIDKTDAGPTANYRAPSGKRLDSDLGYINLTGVAAANNAQPYVDAAHSVLKQITATPVCGWVVDVRQNTGGDMYPMLVAIGPLLGDNDLGYFIDRQGVSYNWFQRAGKSGVIDTIIFQSDLPDLGKDYSTTPVAVLTSANTASSGEVVVISFSGREHTKRFGFATAGLTTGNHPYRLSDGAALIVAQVRESDRNHQLFIGAIEPEVKVKITSFKGDPVLDAATTWLKEECKAA